MLIDILYGSFLITFKLTIYYKSCTGTNQNKQSDKLSNSEDVLDPSRTTDTLNVHKG